MLEVTSWLDWWLVMVSSLTNSTKPSHVTNMYFLLITRGQVVEYFVNAFVSMWLHCMMKSSDTALSKFTNGYNG